MDKAKLNLPPELAKILKYWQLIVTLFFLVILLWSSIFQISTEEVGVITRFGKYVRQVEQIGRAHV
jgi:membrane protease subunit HflK